MSDERRRPEDGTMDPERRAADAGGPAPEAGEEESGGVSRRDFLKGVGVGGGVLGAGILAAAVPAPKPGEPRRFGPGAVPLTLTVNGQAKSVTVEPRATLLDALRERLDLTGAKRVCDRGECGGCTVLLDGRPVYACMILAIDARGRRITTIEGLGEPGRLHPLQESFIEKDAMQCGFCTPGMVVAAKGLLDTVPRPSLDQVKEGLAGHLCRCGTYPRIFEAVQAASRRTEKKP